MLCSVAGGSGGAFPARCNRRGVKARLVARLSSPGRGTGAVRGLMRECAGQFGFLGIVHRGIIRPCPLPLTGFAAQSLRSVVASAA